MGNPTLSSLHDAVSVRFADAVTAEQPLSKLEQALEDIFATAEMLLQEDRSAERDLIACGPGCGYCCVVNVSLSIPEAVIITRFLERLPEPELNRQKEKLDQLWCAVRGLDDEERLACKRSCAFLDDVSNCSIYPVRPLLCRSVTSVDVRHCVQALQQKLFGPQGGVLMHQYQQQLYETIFVAVTAGLSQAGWDGRSFQLAGLVRYLLNQQLCKRGHEEKRFLERYLQWADLYP